MSATTKPNHLESLSLDEEAARHRLERRVERGFYEQGLALKQLHDRRLYRSTHSSWEGYLRDRFNMGRHNANYIIAAVSYVENIAQYQLEQMVTSGHHAGTGASPSAHPTDVVEVRAEVVTSGHQQEAFQLTWEDLPQGLILPTSEKVIRPLRHLPEDKHGEAWAAAVEKNGGRPPSGPQVAEVVRRLERQYQGSLVTANPFEVGQVCLIHAQDHPELRGLGGAPAVVIDSNEFSCTVRTGLGDRLVSRHNLESLDITAREENQMRDRLERLFRLSQAQGQLDPLALTMVRQLSQQPSPYLSPFQEEALQFLEQQYGLGSAGEGEASEPTPAASSLEPLMTSPPAWAQAEVPTESSPPGECFFQLGDKVRVVAAHSIHPNRHGEITEIHADISAAIVKLEGVRRAVVLPFSELEKVTLPASAKKPKPKTRDRGSG